MWAIGGGVIVAGLAAAALVALPAESPAIRAVPVPKGAIAKADGQNYYHGSYIAYAADWAVSTGGIKLRRGVDYADHMIIRPKQFPANTEIWWQWPNRRPEKTGVYGYNHLAYGYYAGGIPPVPIPAVQVENVQELITDFAVETRAERGEFNVLSETFLTTQPKDFATRDVEVGFITEPSGVARRYFETGQQLGEWADPDGQVWKVALAGKYCMLIPAKGQLTQGRLHYGAAFKWLIAREVLTGKEWFNGLAIGVEPVSGAGSMKVKRWRITYR